MLTIASDGFLNSLEISFTGTNMTQSQLSGIFRQDGKVNLVGNNFKHTTFDIGGNGEMNVSIHHNDLSYLELTHSGFNKTFYNLSHNSFNDLAHLLISSTTFSDSDQ